METFAAEVRGVPNMGWLAVFLAPGGVVTGIWKAGPQAQQQQQRR